MGSYARSRFQQQAEALSVPADALYNALLADAEARHMLLAAEVHPFQKRSPALFWRGDETSDQRTVMLESELIQSSDLMDVGKTQWGTPEFEKLFISLPEHCQRK